MIAAAPPPARGGRAARRAISAKLIRYAERLLERWDTNRDGRLQEAEWIEMLLERYDRDGDGRLGPSEWDDSRIARYDRNADGVLEEAEWRRIWTLQRLDRTEEGAAVEDLVAAIATLGTGKAIVLKHAHLGERLKPLPLVSPATLGDSRPARPKPAADDSLSASKERAAPAAGARGGRRATRFFVPRSQLPRGLPPWFIQRDTNGDGQLTLAEYAPNATRSLVLEFTRYDRNRDGVVTAQECARGPGKAPREPAEEEEAVDAAVDTVEEPVEDAETTQEGTEEEEKPEEEEAADEPPAESEADAAPADAAAARAAAKRRRLERRAREKGLRTPSKKSGAKATSGNPV